MSCKDLTLNVSESESATIKISPTECATINFVGVIAGPQGDPGPPGGASVSYPAGETLPAGRVVIIEGGEAFLFQPNDITHQGRAYGITTASANTGNAANIQIIGEVQNAAFTFGPEKILFVYNNGIIVDTDPELAIMQLAGVSTTTNKMRIDFALSILNL
jgi:hypothetical protein